MSTFDMHGFERNLKQAMHESLKRQFAQVLRRVQSNLDRVECPVHGPGRFSARVIDRGTLKLGIEINGCCQAGEEAAGRYVKHAVDR